MSGNGLVVGASRVQRRERERERERERQTERERETSSLFECFEENNHNAI
jgi:hypothetical protein